MAQQTTLDEFNSVYPKLEEALLEHARSYKLPQEQLDWYKRVSLSPNLKLYPTPGNLTNMPPQSPSRSTLSAENATAACPSPIPSPSSSRSLFLRSSTSRLLLSVG